jgi:hypothetical protein
MNWPRSLGLMSALVLLTSCAGRMPRFGPLGRADEVTHPVATVAQDWNLMMSCVAPVELRITDPLGRRCGFDIPTIEIPRAMYVDVGAVAPGPEIQIAEPLYGDYLLEIRALKGTGLGGYLCAASDTKACDLSVSGQVQQGECFLVEFSYKPVTADSSCTITLIRPPSVGQCAAGR